MKPTETARAKQPVQEQDQNEDTDKAIPSVAVPAMTVTVVAEPPAENEDQDEN
jgi:peptidyl-tRNA hydrolase